MREVVPYSWEDEELAFRAAWGDYESAVAACMVAKGHDYTPERSVDNGESVPVPGGIAVDDFVDRFGWGISTVEVERELLAAGHPRTELHPELADLDATQTLAWIEDLRGDPTGTTGYGGCRSEVPDDLQAPLGGIRTPWQRRFDAALDRRWRSTPEVAVFDDDFAVCMSDAGHEWTDRRSPFDLVERDVDRLVAGIRQDLLDTGDIDSLRSLTADDVFAHDEYAPIRQGEVDLAQAALDCGRPPPWFGPPPALLPQWLAAVSGAEADADAAK